MNGNALAKKILILAANPKGTSQLRLDEEVREIEAGLQRAQKRDQFILEQKWAVRPRDIQRALLDINPQIVHFSGHGAGEEGLVFEDEAGRAKLIDGKALAGLFELFAEQVECVVLNGCYSQVQAEAIAKHIPSVIGMSQAIGDRAAIEFVVGFYDALGAGRSVEFAHRLGCSAIRMAGISENLTPVLLEKTKSTWAIVLTATLEDLGQGRLQDIVDYLRSLSDDTSITLKRVQTGSVIIILEGSHDGFKVIESLFKKRELTELLGLPIEYVGHEIPTSKTNNDTNVLLHTSEGAVEVFFSYAHEDEQLRDELAKHLKLLERQKVITAWHDREITAGTEWSGQIDKHLESAKIILLLVSADFLASDYCYDIELTRAMERHEAKEARVIPVILREVDWKEAPFGKLQTLPKNAKAVTNWNNRDQAFADIARGIRKAVEELGEKRS